MLQVLPLWISVEFLACCNRQWHRACSAQLGSLVYHGWCKHRLQCCSRGVDLGVPIKTHAYAPHLHGNINATNMSRLLDLFAQWKNEVRACCNGYTCRCLWNSPHSLILQDSLHFAIGAPWCQLNSLHFAVGGRRWRKCVSINYCTQWDYFILQPFGVLAVEFLAFRNGRQRRCKCVSIIYWHLFDTKCVLCTRNDKRVNNVSINTCRYRVNNVSIKIDTIVSINVCVSIIIDTIWQSVRFVHAKRQSCQ